MLFRSRLGAERIAAGDLIHRQDDAALPTCRTAQAPLEHPKETCIVLAVPDHELLEVGHPPIQKSGILQLYLQREAAPLRLNIVI